MTSHFAPIDTSITFSDERATKADLFRGAGLFAGVNCFEPGQSQTVHSHGGADKFYFVVSGKARMTVGTETSDAEAGTVVWAPAGVPHGVVVALERTVMLVAMGPPPGGGQADSRTVGQG